MRWRNSVVLWTVAFGLAFAVSSARGQALLELSAGIHLVRAEVANTGESRAKGLMQRRNMPANNGMLFVFDRPGEHCMWMRNTLIPLSVAFLDDQGRIINVEEMQPLTEDSHCSAKPAKFALEMNAGWFKAKGMAVGSSVIGIDKAPPAR